MPSLSQSLRGLGSRLGRIKMPGSLQPTGLGRLWRPGGIIPTPKPRPFEEMGTSGTAVWGGYVQVKERSPEWIGRQKWITSSEMSVNTSIVAAGVHYFLNLVSYPAWSIKPTERFEKDKEAINIAAFCEDAINHMSTPWYKVVRNAAFYRFHGFGIQEWTAKKRGDGLIGYRDIEVRPQHSIEQWDVDEDGKVNGVWQRSPQTGALLGMPRTKVMYLVEDTFTDSPEGMGIFRHVADPYKRLKQLQDLEMRAFERDMRGVPIGRAPIGEINKAIVQGVLTKEEGQKLIDDMTAMVKLQVKQSDTGLVLDSRPYFSQTHDGDQVSAVPQWGFELLSGAGVGHAEIAAAIDRVQREIARILGVEHLMMGDQGGNRALSEDKSRNLYLIANSVLRYITSTVEHDLLVPLVILNGWPREKVPKASAEEVTFKNADAITGALSKMAQAGATLQPNDPVVNDVRDLLGVSRVPDDMMAQGAMLSQLQALPPQLQQPGQKPGQGKPGFGGKPKTNGANARAGQGNPRRGGTAVGQKGPGAVKKPGKGAGSKKVRKGNPEFNPDEPRDEQGRWTAEGGGEKLNIRHIHLELSSRDNRVALARRIESFMPGFRVGVGIDLSGKYVMTARRVDSGAEMKIKWYDPHSKDANLFASLMESSDSKEGRRDAATMIRMINKMAVEGDFDAIRVQAGLSMGGYVWPRLGFNLAGQFDINHIKNEVDGRLEDYYETIPKDAADIVRDYLMIDGAEMATNIAKMDIPIPATGSMYVAGYKVRGTLTLGKLLLAGTSAEYILPRAKFRNLAPKG